MKPHLFALLGQLQEPDKSLFFTKNDPEDLRLGDLFKTDPNSNSINFALVGYPDDEGIRLNGGRPGAALGPQKIREFLYKMTPYLKSRAIVSKAYDLGNIPAALSLDEKHQLGHSLILELQKENTRTLSFGGGHDYGYSDAAGFLAAWADKGVKPLVINIDAHLDVRPNQKNGSIVNHSGTPFYRLLNEYPNQFHFVEIGLQPQCNSNFHWDWALQKGAQLFTATDLFHSQWKSLYDLKLWAELKPETPVFISFDIDALASSIAPGCSQSWSTGLGIQECLDFLGWIYKSFEAKGLGIYEVSPPLDIDNQTSKTAALLAHDFIFKNLEKGI